MWLSFLGYANIVVELLKRNEIDINLKDKLDSTALFWACQRGHYDIVVQMLKQPNKVDVTLQDVEGDTVLMMASRNGHIDIVRILLKYKNVDINVQNKRGETAIASATNGRIFEGGEIVALLLEQDQVGLNHIQIKKVTQS